MGEIIPAKPGTGRSGWPAIRALVLAVCYIVLIPAVSVMALLAYVQYFPEQARAFLGPAVKKLVAPAEGEGATAAAEQALSKVTAVEDRLSKLEADIAALAAANEPAAGEAGQTGQAGSQGESPASAIDKAAVEALVTPVREESRGKDRELAALAALTLARSELLSGNREVALREARLAASALQGSAGVPKEATDALASGIDALTKASETSGDWLSIAWHALAQEVLASGTAATP